MTNLDKIREIQEDFQQRNAPFDDVTFPEERLVSELKVQAGNTDEPIHFDMEDRARLAAFFSTLDYNRDANQLVDNLIELHGRSPHHFDPYSVSSKSQLQDAFENIGFRYPSRDAKGWYKNCEILREQYNGRVTELILSVSSNAPDLVERLENDGFLYLKGSKIAPMFARIINDEVAPLNNLWDVEIPVDTHIRRLSKDLFTTGYASQEMDDDWIRREWRAVARAHDIERHVVDGALWHIGNKWDDWGEDYWGSL